MVFQVIHLHVPGPFRPQELLPFREQHARERPRSGGVTAEGERRKQTDIKQLDNVAMLESGDGARRERPCSEHSVSDGKTATARNL